MQSWCPRGYTDDTRYSPPSGELVHRVIPLYGGGRDVLFLSTVNARSRLMDFISASRRKRVDLEARR